MLEPVITKINPSGTPILIGTTLVVLGQRFKSDATQVLINEYQVPVESMNTSGTSLSVRLQGDFLRAGMNTLRIVRQTLTETPPEPVNVTSNTVDFILTPTITSMFLDVREGSIRQIYVTTDVIILEYQPVNLLLNGIGVSSPFSYSLDVPWQMQHGKQMIVPIDNVSAGTYLVRLVVDGTQSPLEFDTDPNSPSYGRYIRPQITV